MKQSQNPGQAYGQAAVALGQGLDTQGLHLEDESLESQQDWSTVLTSTGSGAAAGSVIAPGIGTVIGAAVGFGVGLLGLSANQKARELAQKQRMKDFDRALKQYKENVLLQKQAAGSQQKKLKESQQLFTSLRSESLSQSAQAALGLPTKTSGVRNITAERRILNKLQSTEAVLDAQEDILLDRIERYGRIKRLLASEHDAGVSYGSELSTSYAKEALQLIDETKELYG